MNKLLLMDIIQNKMGINLQDILFQIKLKKDIAMVILIIMEN